MEQQPGLLECIIIPRASSSAGGEFGLVFTPTFFPTCMLQCGHCEWGEWGASLWLSKNWFREAIFLEEIFMEKTFLEESFLEESLEEQIPILKFRSDASMPFKEFSFEWT